MKIPAVVHKALLLASMSSVVFGAQMGHCEQKVIAQIKFDNQTEETLVVAFATGFNEPNNFTRMKLPSGFTYPVEIAPGEAPKLVMGFNGHPHHITARGLVKTGEDYFNFHFFAPAMQKNITAVFTFNNSADKNNLMHNGQKPYIDVSRCHQHPAIEGIGRCCTRMQTGLGDTARITYNCTLPITL